MLAVGEDEIARTRWWCWGRVRFVKKSMAGGGSAWRGRGPPGFVRFVLWLILLTLVLNAIFLPIARHFS